MPFLELWVTSLPELLSRFARTVAGDIKQIWRESVAQNEAYIKRKASGVDDAPVGPLPPYRTMQLTTEWNARYDFELLPVWKLSPNQLGRRARELGG